MLYGYSGSYQVFLVLKIPLREDMHRGHPNYYGHIQGGETMAEC